MNLPVADFIFSNPDWVTLPVRVWVGSIFLVLFLLSLRYGRSGAINAVKRFRWPIAATLASVAAWGIDGSIVLNSPSATG
jgi:putative copper export protein